MDFDMFTRKLGPLPVWGWGAIIGGAFIAWYWYSNAGLESTGSGEEESGVGQTPGPSGDFSTVPVLPEDTDPVVDENTNAEWLVQAVKNAPPGASILAVQAALEKYLNGTKLTAAEGQIVDAIVRKVGLPPQGTAGPPVVGTPKPTPEKPTPEPQTKDTVVTLGAPTVRKFGQAATIRVAVRWVKRGSRLTNPTGRVAFYVDGKKTAVLPLINGGAVWIAVPTRGWESTKDKKWVIDARYIPGNGSPSSATSHVISLSTS